MSLGSAGCGWEYRRNTGRDNKYVCQKLNKTRDGFYCTKYKEHLGYKPIHEFVSNDVEDTRTIETNNPVRCSKCTGRK